jgi:hypothetical protein
MKAIDSVVREGVRRDASCVGRSRRRPVVVKVNWLLPRIQWESPVWKHWIRFSPLRFVRYNRRLQHERGTAAPSIEQWAKIVV